MNFVKVDYQVHAQHLKQKIAIVSKRDNLLDLELEVFTSLSQERSHLFMDECRSIVIIEPAIMENEMVMHVVFCWSSEGNTFKQCINGLYAVANDIKATKIVAASRKLSVLRLCKQFGFEKAGYNSDGLIILEKVLSYG